MQYHLSTDTSNKGLGRVLFQIPTRAPGTKASAKTRKEEEPVIYLSFALTDTESRYSTTEKEVLAVIRCLEEARWLVLGAKYRTLVYTDHTAVRSVMGKHSDATGRLARWHYRLQEYDIEYIHVPGKLQVVADGLSRIPHWEADGTENEEYSFPAFTSATEQPLEQTRHQDDRANYLPYLQDK